MAAADDSQRFLKSSATLRADGLAGTDWRVTGGATPLRATRDRTLSGQGRFDFCWLLLSWGGERMKLIGRVVLLRSRHQRYLRPHSAFVNSVVLQHVKCPCWFTDPAIGTNRLSLGRNECH